MLNNPGQQAITFQVVVTKEWFAYYSSEVIRESKKDEQGSGLYAQSFSKK